MKGKARPAAQMMQNNIRRIRGGSIVLCSSCPRDKPGHDDKLVMLSAVPEQRRKAPLTVAAEMDDPAAWGGIARGPFQFGEPRHQGCAEGAGEMMAPLAPVEAGLAYRAAGMSEHRGIDLQRLGQEPATLAGQFDVVLALVDHFLPFHAVEHLHA